MSEGEKTELTGLGGWLVLVAIGLVLSSLARVLLLVQTFVPIFLGGAWTVLTTPGSDSYHPLWAPLLVFELIGNIGFLVALVSLLVLFFRRARNFPRLYIWVVVLNVPFILVDAWFGSLVLTEKPMFDPDTAKELFRSIVTVAVWVPYMRLSKRVRNTFVA